MGKYENYTDEEIIEALTGDKLNEKFAHYFFFDKCKGTLTYISSFANNSDSYKSLLGEFYVFLSDNDWKVLRQYKKKNKATLSSYLSHCAVNHFMSINKLDEKHKECPISEIMDRCDDADEDKELIHKAVSIAYAMLNENHKLVLDLLVIKEQSALEAADTLWEHTSKKGTDWRTFPVKKVQDTIAMSKRSACNKLSAYTNMVLEELKKSGEFPPQPAETTK